MSSTLIFQTLSVASLTVSLFYKGDHDSQQQLVLVAILMSLWAHYYRKRA